jgi:2-hydroxychromene-2-carboxylate isomerase
MILRVPAAEPDFYFAAMSPYSWLAAERIEQVLPQARWRPVTAAFIFKAAGRTSWGFTAERASGIADCERRAEAYGQGPIRWPDPWPTNDLPVARAMTFAEERGALRPFALGAMRMAFREGRDLAELGVVLEAGERAGLEAAELEAAVGEPRVKDALRAATDAAIARGVFGIPTVLLGRELFWGDDRLEAAAAAYAALGAAGD